MKTPIHILLVDDEIDFLENTAKRLTRRGYASIQTGLRSLEYGANDYCLKPIEFDVLVEKIKIVYREAYGGEAAE
ncbi:MAG: hypothetical protein AUK28_10070 [Desulfobacterales bacterium CG2_30_60_27]|nr:MAG: hypothetical protein AUK28_10070 [Desulfobacterales bacterium CG2_30_60_27]